MASFSLLILKIVYNCFRGSILSKKNLTAVSIAQAMVETVHKKIKSANTNMVLCQKKMLRKKKKHSIIDMLRKGPVAKRTKGVD